MLQMLSVPLQSKRYKCFSQVGYKSFISPFSLLLLAVSFLSPQAPVCAWPMDPVTINTAAMHMGCADGYKHLKLLYSTCKYILLTSCSPISCMCKILIYQYDMLPEIALHGNLFQMLNI